MARPDLARVRQHRRRRLLQHRRGALDPRHPLQHEPDGDPARQPRVRAHQEAGLADLADGAQEQHDAARRDLEALNPLTVTLGVQNVSFVAQAVDWIPELLYDIVARPTGTRASRSCASSSAARSSCPRCSSPGCTTRGRTLLLTHENGLTLSPELSRTYKNQLEHDPLEHRPRARDRLVGGPDPGRHPVPQPRRALLRGPARRGPVRTAEQIRAGLEAELDKFTVWPDDDASARAASPDVDGTRSPTLRERAAMDMAADITSNGCSSRPGGGRARASTRSTDSALRPALLARYRDLTRLRYDFPLVLVDRGPGAGIAALAVLGRRRGAAGDRAARASRASGCASTCCGSSASCARCVAGGARGTLSELWAEAAPSLAAPDDPSAEEVLTHIAEKLQLDGEVVDCDQAMPARVLAHAWQAAQQQQGQGVPRRPSSGSWSGSPTSCARPSSTPRPGSSPEALRAALGGAHRDEFDFAAMSRLVGRNAPKDELPAARRAPHRVGARGAEGAALLPDPRLADRPAPPPTFEFRFDNCAAAAAAFRERLPELAEVVKAIVDRRARGRRPLRRGAARRVLRGFGEHALTADDLALFPDYLVCIPPDRNDAPENAGLMEMLSSGLPVKVLVETADLLEEASVGAGHFAFGVRSARLANTAMGAGRRVRPADGELEPLRAARAPRARPSRTAARRSSASSRAPAPPASCRPTSPPPPRWSRARFRRSPTIPTPATTGRRASRSRTTRSPRPTGRSSPSSTRTRSCSASPRRRRSRSPTSSLCDTRYAGHFARVPRERWNGAMIPVDEWLARDPKAVGDAMPYVLAVDADDVLHRVIVDARLMQIAAPLPDALAPPAGAGRHPQLARRAPARAREGGVGAGEGAGARRAQGRACRRDGRARRRRGGSRRGRRAAAPAARRRCSSPRRRSATRTRRGSRPRAARAATSARSSTTRCSPTTRTSRPTSATSSRHLSADGRGGRGLPGGDHPSRQAVEPERAGAGRADRARGGVPVAGPASRSPGPRNPPAQEPVFGRAD